ncbi:hypothetical protein PoB_001932900 [Plakobranchus ocellatus]|uniref:Uncharacterized protein n=1 Tax=Plakobranchus ocellatus TaxID=259542 RepID=A0AAV3ZEL5_9GAST|nr:hypothetical protein PoB_001932900 [Plakobranchus ocellatus]
MTFPWKGQPRSESLVPYESCIKTPGPGRPDMVSCDKHLQILNATTTTITTNIANISNHHHHHHYHQHHHQKD